MFMVEAASG